MYRGFVIEAAEIPVSKCTLPDAKIYDKKHPDISATMQSLENCFNVDNDKTIIVDGTKLQDEVFKVVAGYNIFFSHSHNDIDSIKSIASVVESMTGLKCFVEGGLWGSADSLASKLYKKFVGDTPLNPNNVQNDYNYITSHVYMMLTNAILKAIDSCEAFFFFKTDHTVVDLGQLSPTTKSPWLFMETEGSRLLRRRIPERYKFVIASGKTELFAESAEGYDILHTMNLDHLTNLLLEKLCNWLEKCNDNDIKGEAALDRLYHDYPPADEEIISKTKGERFSGSVTAVQSVYTNGMDIEFNF